MNENENNSKTENENVAAPLLDYFFLIWSISILQKFKNDFLKTMASGLENYINQTVSVITSDGRNFIGTLKGFDQTINIILDESHERVFSSSTGVAQVVLGLHIIRGDNIAIVGQIDESIDSRLDLGNIRAEPLGPIVH